MVKQTITCRHLGKLSGTQETSFGLEPVQECVHPAHSDVRPVDCVLCADFYLGQEEAQAISGCCHPGGVVVNRYEQTAAVEDLFKGAQGFLLLGGPSAKELPLEKLSRRGVLLLAVNNALAMLPQGVRPQVWFHTDPTGKFCDSIWRDPGILKLSPVKEWKSHNPDRKRGLRHRVDGKIVDFGGLVGQDMPTVLGFHRNHNFNSADWLHEATINNGNDERHATGKHKGKKVGEPNGWPKTINTMLAAVRLCFYLGIKTLYLVGADFRMDESKPYGFEQTKSKGGVRGNNSAYADLNCMFDGLVPEFQKAGFEVYNTNPESCLWSFPFLEFEEAIERATGSFEQTLNTQGWYGED